MVMELERFPISRAASSIIEDSVLPAAVPGASNNNNVNYNIKTSY